MQIVLCNKGMYMVTMGTEVEPQQHLEKLKYLNKLDEAIGFMCIDISRELLFHFEGLRTPKEVRDNIESLFGKKDELKDHILENELITLQPNNFKTIQQFFSKFKSLVMQSKQCGIDYKDEQLVLSILSKLGPEFSVFVSTFHSRRLTIHNWKIPSLDAFNA